MYIHIWNTFLSFNLINLLQSLFFLEASFTMSRHEGGQHSPGGQQAQLTLVLGHDGAQPFLGGH